MNLNNKRYRFILDGVVEVIPLNVPKVKIKWEKESGQLFFRKKLSGKLVFKKGGCAGFETTDTGMPIVDGYQYINEGRYILSGCKRYYLEIEEQCAGEWNSIYSGYFNIFDGEWDEDNCVVQIKVEPNDGYDCLLKKWDVKHNLYALDLANKNIKGETLTSWFDVILIDIKEEEQQDCNDFIADYPNICEYGWVCSRGYQRGNKWWHVHIYVRECSNRKINSSFIQDYDAGLWCRPYNVNNSPRVIACGSAFDQPNPYPNDPHWKQYFNVNDNNDYFYINTGDYNYYDNLQIRGNLTHQDVITSLIGELNCNGVANYESRLFNDATNYVTGENPNPLNEVYINQKSNVVRYYSGTAATKFELSLQDYLKYLAQLFQAYFFLRDGKVVIEHISEFNGGAGVNLVTLDNGRYLVGKNKYSYNRAEMAYREDWEIGDDKNHFVEYPSRCANMQTIKKYSETQIFTDTGLMMGNEDAGLDGVVFIIKDPVSDDILNDNAYLRLNNLIPLYWKEKRPFLNGAKNRVTPFSANTSQSFKEQTALEFKHCCKDFNPLDKIKTQLGDGEVKSAEYSLTEATINVKLTHYE